MRRRDLLGLAGTAALGSLAGCSLLGDREDDATPTPQSTDTPPSPERRFDRTVDLVEAGADPTGEEPIDPVLDEVAGSDTKVVLPEGEYRLRRFELADAENFALVGDDARLVPASQGAEKLCVFSRVSDLWVSGLTVDQSGPDRCGWMDVRVTGGTNVVSDVRLEGRNDVTAGTFGFTLLCEGADTELRLDSVDLGDGGRNAAGIYVFPQRDYYDSDRDPGTLVLRDCVLKNWAREGLYASPHGGPIRVVGGRYENNAIDQVRVGGGHRDSLALVRDVTIVADDPPSYIVSGSYGNLRGIWLEEGCRTLVDNCTVHIADLGEGGSDGGIVIGSQCGRAHVANTTVRVDERVPAVTIDEPASEFDAGSMPSLDSLPDAWRVTFENVTIEGDSDAGAAINLIDRNGCTFQNVDLDQSSGSRHGLFVTDAVETVVSGGRWQSGGYPVLVRADDRITSTTTLLCFEDIDVLESARSSGGTIEVAGDSLDGRRCVSPALLQDSEDGAYDRYVGITGIDEDTFRGSTFSAIWNGQRLVER